VHQKENPQKPLTKIKRIREEMQTSLQNRKKVATDSPRSVFNKKNRVEEGGASGIGMKRHKKS
jgi:hypothetical protein